MNRGDFGLIHMPKSLRIVAPGKYQVVNGFAAAGGAAGFALGTFGGAAPAALGFKIPDATLAQLRREGLVTASKVDLYNDALSPFKVPASAANVQRYMSLLQQLLAVETNDGP